MLQNIKKNHGFTLIELLVAVTIMGAISAVSVKLLYDTVSVRSKQYSIENSADSVRLILSTMSSTIQSGQNITFPSANSIKIMGYTDKTTNITPCWQFQYNSTKKTIEQIKDETDN
ncbi:MAG: prepilin-type N-terminal cleavage/methylation domain-containing protein, partial [bacterium]|nr:prepilin-type N-terminal cleavage/methylation domain-containing protein [bacterium]